MEKLRLDVNALRVESFASAEAEAEERGTVRGRMNPSIPPWCLIIRTRPTDCPCTP